MNGRKARQARNRAKSALPPGLREERSARVGVLAAARNVLIKEANEEYNAAEQKIRIERNAAIIAAYDAYEVQRDAVRAEIDRKAAEAVAA